MVRRVLDEVDQISDNQTAFAAILGPERSVDPDVDGNHLRSVHVLHHLPRCLCGPGRPGRS